jgi:UDP-2,3-diacylglucosamine pyrophosphatase LpxH
MAPPVSRRRYRSVFLSDLHLGSPTCRADAVLDFLNGLEAERLYLLGDVVDGWRLRRRWFWPRSHAAVLDRLLQFARDGVAVTYVPGNHDAFARAWCGLSASGVRVEREGVHEAADGRRYLLAHGDAYDPEADRSWLARFAGDLVYRALMRLDRAWRWSRRRQGQTETSLAAWAKGRSALARRVVGAFEAELAAEAGRRGFDGVVCGHIHSAAARELDGVAYVNCGDWVESCSAAVETASGRLEVLRWSPRVQPRPQRAPVATPAPAWSA